MPDSMIAIISSVVATGRRMKGREGLMASWRVRHGASRERRAPPWRCAPPAAAAGADVGEDVMGEDGAAAADGGSGAAADADDGAGAGAGADAVAGGESRTTTLAPLRSLSAPSITTRSPGDRPERTATRSPLLGRRSIGFTVTVLSALMR